MRGRRTINYYRIDTQETRRRRRCIFNEFSNPSVIFNLINKTGREMESVSLVNVDYLLVADLMVS